MSTPTRTSELASLSHATEWINSPPLTEKGLQGKVVLVQFWTYSCINWLRTMPYVRAWAEKYRDKGLVVIGVHSPEFGFEKQLPNVRWGAKNYRVDYPIAVDNDFAIWRGFGNQYWPALYLFDGKGNVRHRQFGEGGYEETERAIQKLLAEAGASGVGKDLASVAPGGVEAQADWDDVKSPETYVGTDRGENRVAPDARLRLNQWALGGDWTVQAAARGAQQGRRADHVSLPRPRPQPGDGAGRGREAGALPGAHRRTAARVPRTASMWTSRATGPSPSPGCIS